MLVFVAPLRLNELINYDPAVVCLVLGMRFGKVVKVKETLGIRFPYALSMVFPCLLDLYNCSRTTV